MYFVENYQRTKVKIWVKKNPFFQKMTIESEILRLSLQPWYFIIA